MTIVDFYTELSKIIENSRVSNYYDGEKEIATLLEKSKMAGLVMNVDAKKLISMANDSAFDEINSYDSYEEEDPYDTDSSSYDDDDNDLNDF